MSTYRGFSTVGHLANPAAGFMLTDRQLITRDLLNHIYTAKGERPMLPDFGTRIPLLSFEPLDPTTIKMVEDDLRHVFRYDPRVELVDLAVVAVPDQNTILALADLRYINLGIVDTLRLEFAVGA